MSKKSDIGAMTLFQDWLNKKKENESEAEASSNVHNADSPAGSSANEGYIHYPTQEKGQTLTFENVRIDFPLRPYAAQVQMMRNIVHTINGSENALLESPTGSGKSLALLCAALAWRENEMRKYHAQTELEQKIKTEKAAIKNEKYPPRLKSIAPLQQQQELQTVIEIQDDTPPNATFEKRKLEVADENQPENWAKKFKFKNESSSVIVVNDEDSFEDFQTPAIPVKKSKIQYPLNDENSPPDSSSYSIPAAAKASSEEGNISAKSETFQRVPRIFVGSRTHKQITQLVSELKKKTRYNPRTTILGSREHLCIHPKVSKSSNKAEDCFDLLDKKGCPYGQKTRSIISHPSLQSKNRVWDIEDMVQLGKKVKGCPYYASRKLYETAEVIFCPYNYIIDPIIRKILDINLKGSIVILDEAHNIEDSSRSAGSFETDERVLFIVKKELAAIIRNGFEVDAHEKIEYLIDNLYNWITAEDNDFAIKEYESHYCHWTGDKLINKLKGAAITSNTFNNDLKPAYKKASAHAEVIRKEKEREAMGEEPELAHMTSSQVQIHQRKCLSNNSLSVIQGIFLVLGFLFQEGKNYADDYQMVLTKRIERGGNSSGPKAKNKRFKKNNVMEPEWCFKLAFKCLNPGIIFRDMTETTRSVILTSGTLSPLNTFAGELETKFEGRLEANHVIDKSQVWVGGIMKGPSGVSLKGVFSNLESFGYQDDVGEALCEIIETMPHGVLCFMSSYNALDKLMERWKLTGLYERLAARKLIITEPRGSDKNEFENAINKFYKQIDNVRECPDEEGRDGALFFAVFRGKVSEGIDFTDEYCRAVVTVGIPYPGMMDMDVKFKKEYNDQKRSKNRNSAVLSSNEWYSAQAFRAINQALGRCIRHKNDWGAIILLEERFSEAKNVKNLSKWVRGQYQNYNNYSHAVEDLKEFVGRQLARTAAGLSQSESTPTLYQSTTASPQIARSSMTYSASSTAFNADQSTLAKDSLQTSATFAASYIDCTVDQAVASTTVQTNSISISHHIPISSSENLSTLYQSPLSYPSSASYTSATSILNPVTSQFKKPFAVQKVQNNNLNSISPENTASSIQPSINNSTNFTIDDEDDFLPPAIPEAKSAYFKDNSPKKISTTKPEFKAPDPIERNTWKPKPLVPDLKHDGLKLPTSSANHIKREELHDNDSTDSTSIRISCTSCGRLLLEGLKRNLYPVSVDDLTLIAKNPDIDKSNMVEVIAPSQWRSCDALVGGPVNIKEWPRETTVTINAEDGVCYRLLHCRCNDSKPQGVIIRQCFEKKNLHYQGSVFLWLTQLVVQKNIATEQKPVYNDEDFEIGSSQIPTMNDMFYSL